VSVRVSVRLQEGERLCVIDGKDLECDHDAVLEVEELTEGEIVGEGDRGDKEIDTDCVLLYDGVAVEDQLDEWVIVWTPERLSLQLSVRLELGVAVPMDGVLVSLWLVVAVPLRLLLQLGVQVEVKVSVREWDGSETVFEDCVKVRVQVIVAERVLVAEGSVRDCDCEESVPLTVRVG